MYFTPKSDMMYVTTAKPGHLHIFDLKAGPKAEAGEVHRHRGGRAPRGVHQGLALRLCRTRCSTPGMSDGSITIVDLKEQKVIGSVDTLKNKGYNPNSIVLPKWNHLAGH